MKCTLHFLILIVCISCKSRLNNTTVSVAATASPVLNKPFDSSKKVIHVLVALCDNRYQGIVPVPAAIGNGQDANNNLYWGCSYGIRTFFKKSSQWKLLKQYKIDSIKLERLIFKHSNSNFYLVADAYNGKFIKQCTIDFLRSCSGQLKDVLSDADFSLGINGNADLLAYIGHDGLMDFTLQEKFSNTDNRRRDAIMLACISKKYFAPHLRAANANPVLWSTGLMAPEAYTLHDALQQYINHQPAKQIQIAAAKAYAKYQHCSERAAGHLLVSGW